MIAAAKEKMARKHVVLLRSSSSDRPLFIIPGTGGKTNYFQQLALLLSDRYSVFGINLKGTEPREKPQHHVKDIASLLISWIRQVQPHGPYRFLSHCFGGNIAFEMALQLQRRGEPTEFIAMMDGEAGNNLVPETTDTSADAIRLIADYLNSFDILKPPYPEWVNDLRKELSFLPINQMMPHVSAVLQKRIPSKKNAIRHVAHLVQVNLHHAQIVYAPLGKTSSEIYVFRPEGRQHEAEALGWENHAGKIMIVQVPGDHHTMVIGKSAKLIAHHLGMRL